LFLKLIPDLVERVMTDELSIDIDRDIIQSKFVQSDLPTLVKGGVQLKKIAETGLGLPGTRYEYRDGKKIKRATGQVVGDDDIKERIVGSLVGQSLSSSKVYGLIAETAKGRSRKYQGQREAARMAVQGLIAKDKNKAIEGIRQMVLLGVKPDQVNKRLTNELLRQSLERQYVYARSLPKEDKFRFLQQLKKLENDYNLE